MIRLKDIAQQAGVSVMTVSKVMRDAPDISPATKTRIRALVQKMGYVPDALAQGLRTRKTRLLGLVIPSITNPIFARTVLAIEERAFKLGYDLILAHTLNQPDREEACLRHLLARRVDGVIVHPVYRLAPAAPIYNELYQLDRPTILLGHRAAFCNQFVNLETDDLQASQAMTQHLLGLGHKRIAFFSGPAAAPWAQERLEGYRRALREAQIESDDHLVFNAGSTIEEGEQAAAQLLGEAPGATAVQAVNDLVAVGAAKVFLNRGLHIPRDLSLAGFGNCLVSEFNRVPLTTVRQPKYRLGLAVMDTMEKMLRGEHPPSQRLCCELIIRASTGPANTPPTAA